MIISNFCVGFVVFIVLLAITGILGLLNMLMTDEENLFAIFVAWITSTAGLAACLTYILVMKGFI
jgi:hypothetical protein